MNFNDLQEACWRYLGRHDSGNRLDWQRQEIRDAINRAYDEVVSAVPFMSTLVEENTISLVNGTSIYTLNDWVKRPLSFWTVDSAAHKVQLRLPRGVDRDGSRSTQNYSTLGPYQLALGMRTATATKSGTSATVAEGSTSLTKSGGSNFASTDVGRMIRLNGEDADYKIAAYVSTSAVTLDRAVRSRLTGLGTTGVGSGYTSVRWEMGPVGRFQLNIVPTPTVSGTLYYRYYRLQRRLVNADDTPEIPEEYHFLLWVGALKWLRDFDEDSESYARAKQEYVEALENLRQMQHDDIDSDEVPPFDTQLYEPGVPLQRDVSFRGSRMYY